MYLDYSTEITEAKKTGQPIVALESTIIAHGMPYPQNLETAQRVEQLIRDEGAVPATMAILHGRVKAGLDTDDLHYLATAKGIAKASRRDLPILMAQGKSAATTVAATMICAQMAGVRIFATGGIGGVHRGGADTFDISADLQELARTSVAVVSAGAKAILDLELTLEYLETHGVPVIGVGTDDFPAFYSRSSGIAAPYRLDTPAEIAAMLRMKWEMGLEGGALIANPIPEAASLPREQIQQVIDQSIQEAESQGIKGKKLTPFLLARIAEISAGKSLVSNIELVYHNARLAAKIACAM